ncbi:MAG: calcium/sodium antiporter [Pseudomonadota bacterium]
MDALILLLGLVVLVKAADFLVDGATVVAARAKVSPLVIGLTIVSFGTSLPEMLVTLFAGLNDSADLAIANVLGSNIANLLLVLGVAACVSPLTVRDSTIVSELPFSLTAALLVGFLANAHLFTADPRLTISRVDGCMLLFFFSLFMLYVFKIARTGEQESAEVPDDKGMPRAFALIALGMIGLYFGGQWVVDGAVGLARLFNVGDALIGLTIVAIGTSSPEVVASAVAAYRGQADLAVGNAVGSSIFNLLWVLGVTATVVELPFTVISNTDLLAVIGASALIILALVTSRSYTLRRYHGIVFVLIYAGYIAYVVQRG